MSEIIHLTSEDNSDLDIPQFLFYKKKIRMLLSSQSDYKPLMNDSLTFKCFTNEHRRACEEILSQEKIWIAARLRVIRWRMKVKQAFWKVAYCRRFVLPVHWMRSCKNSSVWLCNWSCFFFFNYLRTKAKQRLTLAFPNFSVLDFAILIVPACSWEWFLMSVHIYRERERESLLDAYLEILFNT